MSTTNTNNLVVPRRSISGSISSVNSLMPQFMPSHRHSKSSSNMKLSTTNTNNESTAALSTYDFGHKKPIDNLPTARSSMTYSDKLWTQIDVLDDVRNMSEQVKQKGSFFNSKFTDELAKLKSSQDKLAQVMESHLQSKHIKGNRETTLPGSQKSASPENEDKQLESLEHEEEREITDFFKYDHQNRTQFLQGLTETKQYVEAVRQNLDEVAASMKRIDETMRENW